MAGYHIRLQPQVPQQAEHRQANRAEGGLRNVGLRERLLPGLFLLAAERGRWKDVAAQVFVKLPVKNTDCLLENSPHLREDQEQVLKHAGILGSLSRKQEGEFALRS